MKVNWNLTSQSILNRYNQFEKLTSKHLKKLSSGKRITAFNVDAAGGAISERFTYTYRGTMQANQNIQNALSLLQTAEGGLETSHVILQRMRKLSVQAANDTLTDDDRYKIQLEIEQLKSQLNDIAFDTKYNDKRLLGPVDKSKADIVFLLDDSGSCDAEINSVKGQLDSWIDDLSSTFEEIKVASVSFASNVSIDQTLTDDMTAVKNAMSNRGAAGGGEFIYNGINTIVNNINWDTGWDRYVIALTDDGSQDEQPPNDVPITRENALADLQNNNIVYTSIDPGGDVTPGVGGWYFGGHGDGPDTSIGATNYNEDQEYDYLTDGTNGIRGTFADINLALSQIKNNIIANATLQMENPFIWHIGSDMNQIKNGIIPFDARPTNLNVDNISLLTRTGAENAISNIDIGIEKVSYARAFIGSETNALIHKINFNGAYAENILSANSKLSDTDFASQMTQYVKNNIITNKQFDLVKAVDFFNKQSIELMKNSAVV